MNTKEIINLLKDLGAVTHEDILDALCDGDFLKSVGITNTNVVEDTYNAVMEEKYVATILKILTKQGNKG